MFDGVTFTGELNELVVFHATLPPQKTESRGLLGRTAALLDRVTGTDKSSVINTEHVVRTLATALKKLGVNVYTDAEKKVYAVQLRNANLHPAGYAQLRAANFDPSRDDLHFVGQRFATNSRRFSTVFLDPSAYTAVSQGINLNLDGSEPRKLRLI
jgi:hypothetical protein